MSLGKSSIVYIIMALILGIFPGKGQSLDRVDSTLVSLTQAEALREVQIQNDIAQNAPLQPHDVQIIAQATSIEASTQLIQQGMQRFQQQDVAGAIELAQQALAMREAILGRDHPGVAYVLDVLGIFQATAGNFAAGEALFQRAIEIYQAHNHPNLTDVQNNLELLYARQAEAAQTAVSHPPSDDASGVNAGVNAGIQAKFSLFDQTYLQNVSLEEGPIQVIANAVPRPSDSSAIEIRLQLRYDGETILDYQHPDYAFPDDPDGGGYTWQSGIVALEDLDSDRTPEVILYTNWGGVYAGGVHYVFQYRDGRFVSDHTEPVAGGRDALAFQDLENDGQLELWSQDSRFDYKFSSRAGSAPPLQIYRLNGGTLLDVTREYPDAIEQQRQVVYDAFQRSKQDGVEVNGLLAGYLALSALLGEYEQGWQVVEANYDRRVTNFLTELQTFLVETGYIDAGVARTFSTSSTSTSSTSTSSTTAIGSPYIGLKHQGFRFDQADPNLPEGWELMLGTLLTDLSPTSFLSLSVFRRSNELMLWYELGTRSDPQQTYPSFEVLDVAEVSIEFGEWIYQGRFPDGCSRGNGVESEIIAIGQAEDAPQLNNIRKAWWANPRSRKLEAISPEGVVCQNPAWGI